MKKQSISSLLSIAILLMSMLSPILAVSARSELTTNPHRTQTTCELASIEFHFMSNTLVEREIGLVGETIQEFRGFSRYSDQTRIDCIFEIRYASVYSMGKENARRYGNDKYQRVIERLVAMAEQHGVKISSNIDDLELQDFAMAQALSATESDIVDFAKFIDIYENYAYNDAIRKIVASLETRTFASAGELLCDDDFNNLLIMMPIIAAKGPEYYDPNTPLDGYNAFNAVNYAATWWNKTNNTSYGYYAVYHGHPSPTNNNMWSGGTGNDQRTWNDCTNFVSQCLKAGGAQTKHNILFPINNPANWHYCDFWSNKPSHSWGGAHSFYSHWSNRVGMRLSPKMAKVGDPCSLDLSGDGVMNHTIIIVSEGPSLSEIKYACHTIDQYAQYGKSLQTVCNAYDKVYVYSVG